MDEIRQPGKWLEDKLTQQEQADFMKMLDLMLELKTQKDPNKIIDTLSPYMNSFMHLMYLLIRNQMGLEATDEGIKYRNKTDTYFDLVGYVTDFILKKYDVGELMATAQNSMPSMIAKISKELDLPIDKANRQFWALMENTNGQWKIAANTIARKDEKKGKDSLILINVDMSRIDDLNIKLSKNITTFDKYVYMAVDALYRANDTHTMTVTNIYKQMGNDKSPSSTDIKKIMDSLTKMSNTQLILNNDIEREAYPNYPVISYEGRLLEARFIKVKVKNKAVNGAVQILAELPLMQLARQRGQITTIDRQLLAAPVSKTSENMDIMDLLIDRIATAKTGSLSSKILYSYIYEHAKITTKKQRQRLPDKVRKILEYYKKCGHIKGYTESPDGITILL